MLEFIARKKTQNIDTFKYNNHKIFKIIKKKININIFFFILFQYINISWLIITVYLIVTISTFQANLYK